MDTEGGNSLEKQKILTLKKEAGKQISVCWETVPKTLFFLGDGTSPRGGHWGQKLTFLPKTAMELEGW